MKLEIRLSRILLVMLRIFIFFLRVFFFCGGDLIQLDLCFKKIILVVVWEREQGQYQINQDLWVVVSVGSGLSELSGKKEVEISGRNGIIWEVKWEILVMDLDMVEWNGD